MSLPTFCHPCDWNLCSRYKAIDLVSWPPLFNIPLYWFILILRKHPDGISDHPTPTANGYGGDRPQDASRLRHLMREPETPCHSPSAGRRWKVAHCSAVHYAAFERNHYYSLVWHPLSCQGAYHATAEGDLGRQKVQVDSDNLMAAINEQAGSGHIVRHVRCKEAYGPTMSSTLPSRERRRDRRGDI